MGKIIFNLKRTIDNINLSQNKLSVVSGIRPATINDLYHGLTRRIELDTLNKLIDALNTIDSSRIYTIDDIIQHDPS